MRRTDPADRSDAEVQDLALPPVPLMTRASRVLLNAFRHVDRFRERYDEAELAQATALLTQEMSSDRVQGAVSDLLLIDHELRWHSLVLPDFEAPGARRVSAFEQQLLDLIAAEQHGEPEIAIDLALAFGARRPGVLLLVARKLALRLFGGRVLLSAPSACTDL